MQFILHALRSRVSQCNVIFLHLLRFLLVYPPFPPQRSYDCFLLVETSLWVHAGKCGCLIISKYLSSSNRIWTDIYSVRGAKHRVDYSVHIRWDRERYLLYYMENYWNKNCKPKTIKSLRNKSTFYFVMLLQTFIKQPGSPLCFYLSDLTRDDIQQRIGRQHAFDSCRPSKSILFGQKNKENVLSNYLFSANFFVNIKQNLDWARADCVPARNFRTDSTEKIRILTIKNTHPKLCRLLGVFRYCWINNSFSANLFQLFWGKPSFFVSFRRGEQQIPRELCRHMIMDFKEPGD